MKQMQMPAMGESIHEATVLSWLKKVGDTVALDEPLLEVATDKVDTDISATVSGVLKEIYVQVGEIATIGKPLCAFEGEDAQQKAQISDTLVAPEIEKIAEKILSELPIQTEKPVSGRFYSPLVLTISDKENISKSELDQLQGSGKDGRVTKEDIFAYLANKSATPEPIAPIVKVQSSDNQEIISMDRMRKLIAERMVASKQISPHVTSFVETDMTNIVAWREREKKNYQKKFGENITFTPILIEAVVKAIQDFPLINCSVDGDKIILKKDINIGLAVALPNGNLIVPVIQQAQTLNLIGITKAVNALSQKARNNQLKPDDLANGTYTVSNIGTFGNIMGTPIILQPQVAIMAFGVIEKKPAVITTTEGDFIGIRQKMFISHSYDHRVVDGSLGGQFVKRVSDYLERFDTTRSFK